MKESAKESVLHDWIAELPFTMQALLLLGTRGPDGNQKYCSAKNLVYYLRGVVIKPAYPNFMGKDGFMSTKYFEQAMDREQWPAKPISGKFDNMFSASVKLFFGDLDNYPMHFIMHLIHAGEVIAYFHPDEEIKEHWLHFYITACKGLHMNPETKEQLAERLKY